MSFGKTIGTRDPWNMLSDGWMTSRYKKTRNWERREYSKARRREALAEIEIELEEARIQEELDYMEDILR